MKTIYQLITCTETGIIYRTPLFFKSQTSAFEFFVNEVQKGEANFNYKTDFIHIVEYPLSDK